ncbi:hypothetical protein OtV5_102c [Ostreococcus tauri virus OtV5]|uniref:Uncharacterized protein n=1 Tax=Ostreococcus tauri virus OtV5 TaxID=1785753 RepID=A9YW10_9PHYC|nr:hypothetical protein OtV5_102c [Ostreococcus tauri virus OtV5]YP_009172870.1 hypothetical protein AP053_gp110 [Ostreococcus mediterraneus virus 1]ABY27893.1 hypothetical protein OtV5_102c [Ostreococcus tauri virus OtV5]ALI95221.1 hypothetical protein OmV1_110c [Ostreococcus mediterraneus virus 1]
MISINDVTKIDEKRKQIRKEIYTRVYEQFSRKIKQSVELGHKQVFLTVPTFVIGYPTFDRGAAARYIMRQFKLGGFDVRLVGDYDMYVSWVIPKKSKQKTVEPDETEFPDLMNLKKMADKYRRGA